MAHFDSLMTLCAAATSANPVELKPAILSSGYVVRCRSFSVHEMRVVLVVSFSRAVIPVPADRP